MFVILATHRGGLYSLFIGERNLPIKNSLFLATHRGGRFSFEFCQVMSQPILNLNIIMNCTFIYDDTIVVFTSFTVTVIKLLKPFARRDRFPQSPYYPRQHPPICNIGNHHHSPSPPLDPLDGIVGWWPIREEKTAPNTTQSQPPILQTKPQPPN